MTLTVLIHMANTDPVLAEIDGLPDPQSSYLLCTNPRARDGKRLISFEPECTRFFFPWHRISFVEAYPSDEDHAQIETFFRD